jgi:hypothetical protein
MKKIVSIYTFAFLLFSNLAIFAQGDEDDGGGLEGNDPPAAPINSKLIILLIIGILFAFYAYKKNRKQIQK